MKEDYSLDWGDVSTDVLLARNSCREESSFPYDMCFYMEIIVRLSDFQSEHSWEQMYDVLLCLPSSSSSSSSHEFEL